MKILIGTLIFAAAIGLFFFYPFAEELREEPATSTPAIITPPISEYSGIGIPPGFRGPTSPPHIIGPKEPPPNN